MKRRDFVVLGGLGGAAMLAGLRLRGRGLGTGDWAGPIALAPLDTDEAHLAFDGAGNAYRLVPERHRLLRLGPAGETAWEHARLGRADGELNGPGAIAFDGRDHLWVADTGNGRVQVFRPDGSLERVVGRDGDGELQMPGDLAFDRGGRLHVCDTLNHRIQVFDGDGRFVRRYGAFGHGPRPAAAALNGPRGIACAPDGRIHVVDGGNARVVVFTDDGRAVDRYGGRGAAGGGLRMPRSIAFDTDGRALVADAVAGRIHVFDDGGHLVGGVTPRDAAGREATPLRVARAPRGRLHVTIATTGPLGRG